MRAIGYCRVSTTEQASEGVSLEAQQARIAAYCQFNDLDLVGVVVDGGITGKNIDRAGLQQVLALVAAGKVDALVVTKLDRLSRRVVDTLALLEQFDRTGVAFHSIAERVDTKSAFGRFLTTVLAAMAEMERGVIAERTSAALQHKIAIGEHVGSPAFGYRISDGKLAPVDSELATARQIASLRSEGATLQAIADRLNAQGVPTKRRGRWAPQTVKNVLGRVAAPGDGYLTAAESQPGN